jgi:hypothetical protein
MVDSKPRLYLIRKRKLNAIGHVKTNNMKKVLAIVTMFAFTACFDATVTNPLIVKEVAKSYGSGKKYKVTIGGDLPDVIYYTDSLYKVGDTLK